MDRIFTGICMAISAVALLGFSCSAIACLANNDAAAVGSSLMAIAMAIVFTGTLVALTISPGRPKEGEQGKSDGSEPAWSKKAWLGRQPPQQPE